MAAATNYTELNVLNYILTTTALTGSNARPTAWYVALFTAAPSDSGGGTECTGGSYARQSVAFTVAQASGVTTGTNTATITFPLATANWGTVTHLAVMDALTSGNMLFHGALTASKQIDSGDTFQITAGNLSIELQ